MKVLSRDVSGRLAAITVAIAFVAVGALPRNGWATTNATYYVVSVGSWSDGHVNIKLVSTPGGTQLSSNASCASATPTLFSLGTVVSGVTDPQQKGMLAIATSAMLSGRPVEVAFTGTCIGTQEKINSLFMK